MHEIQFNTGQAQVALLVPWRPLAFLTWLLATRTTNHAVAVLLRIADYCPGPRACAGRARRLF